MPDATILRPSILFGPEDDFFNRFAALARMSPALPLIGGGATKFQPVFVGDVAQAVMRAVGGWAKGGTIYELGGPEVKTFRALMEYVLAVTERKRLLVPLPFGLAKLKASLLQLMPKPLLTPDQVELLRTDNIVSEAALARGPHAHGLRHRAGRDGGDRAELSVALPQGRAVPRAGGVTLTALMPSESAATRRLEPWPTHRSAAIGRERRLRPLAQDEGRCR